MSALDRPSEEDSEQNPQIRLQKFLASAGLGSRRNCEEFILDGRVTVDGETLTDLGVRVDPRTQVIQLDGERIRPQRKRYYLLNKPPGYVCTNHDPQGRPRAIDLVPQDETRLFTVGRLDENSRGLIVVTNDGELAHRMAHPRFSVPRRYQVHVAGNPTQETFNQLREGIHFSEGKFTFSKVHRIRTQGKSTVLEVELHQGRNRELRRMLARVGHKVMSLERVTFGPLNLGRLTIGKYRPLRTDELAELRELADDSQKTKNRRPTRKKSARSMRPDGQRSRSRKPASHKPKRKHTQAKRPR